MRLSGLILVVLLCVVPLDTAFASGYHPPFDEAFAEAELVVMGPVIQIAGAEDGPIPEVDESRLPYSVYQMNVAEVYKGNAQPEDLIIVWDPYGMSTAGYYISDGTRNLIFLVEVDLSEWADRRIHNGMYGFEGKPTVADTDLGKFPPPIYMPIRNIDKEEAFPEEFECWLKLLDLKLNPPDDLLAEYRRIARESDNDYVLRYVTEHWPKPLSDDDVALFNDLVRRHGDDPLVTRYALGALNAQDEALSDEALVDLIKRTAWYGQDTVLEQVNAGNIDACREALLGWLLADEDGHTADDVIRKLADLAPEWLEGRLRETELPNRYLIPTLQALGINGSAVGREDVSPELLELDVSLLGNVETVISGDVSHVAGIIEDWVDGGWCYRGSEDEWRTAAPLLVPALQDAATPQRRAIQTIIGTLGFTVDPDGPSLKPLSPPIELSIELVMPEPSVKGPVVLRLVETATRSVGHVCLDGPAEWSLETPQYWTSRGPGTWDMWEDPGPARDRFVALRAGETRTTELDISDAVEGPGKYVIGAIKYYPYIGSEHGLDAWTGAVWADAIEFTVAEAQARAWEAHAEDQLAYMNARMNRILLLFLAAAGGMLGLWICGKFLRRRKLTAV